MNEALVWPHKDKEQISLYLPPPLRDLIRQRAALERRSVSAQIEVMLEAWLKEEKRQQQSA